MISYPFQCQQNKRYCIYTDVFTAFTTLRIDAHLYPFMQMILSHIPCAEKMFEELMSSLAFVWETSELLDKERLTAVLSLSQL